MNTELNIPKAISIGGKLNKYNLQSDTKTTIEALKKGDKILISEFFSNGLTLLEALQKYLKKNLPNKTFLEQKNYRSEYHRLSNLILVEIEDQKIALKKAPEIGWLQKFYLDNDNFYLTFPQVQGLNSSWQWYKNGISLPVLRNKIHPFYGTYFPTRFEHLIMFDNWLKRYEGQKKTAIDVGVGCGVLSFQMVQHGFQKVLATDTNPNAIFGLQESMGTTKLSRKIELDHAHLFGKWEKQTELIVFNPPWLPRINNADELDEAIYYDKKLFPEFFAEAKKRLLPEGRLLLIFSNLAQINKLTKEHPIEKELAEGNRFELERCFTKSVKAASDKTKRDLHWRSDEIVELWVLKNN